MDQAGWGMLGVVVGGGITFAVQITTHWLRSRAERQAAVRDLAAELWLDFLSLRDEAEELMAAECFGTPDQQDAAVWRWDAKLASMRFKALRLSPAARRNHMLDVLGYAKLATSAGVLPDEIGRVCVPEVEAILSSAPSRRVPQLSPGFDACVARAEAQLSEHQQRSIGFALRSAKEREHDAGHNVESG